MKVVYTRSGGFANIKTRIEFESSQLPSHLQNVLQNCTESPPREPTQSDDFFHELKFADGREFRCTDSRCTQEMIQLFDYLTRRREDAKKK
jgi:Emfourin